MNKLKNYHSVIICLSVRKSFSIHKALKWEDSLYSCLKGSGEAGRSEEGSIKPVVKDDGNIPGEQLAFGASLKSI